jgi:hypothetical protein
MRVELASRVDRASTARDTIARIVVLKENARVVVGADFEDQAMTPLEDGTGRQDFDLDGEGLERNYLLDFVRRMKRPVGSGARRVELAMRQPQPAVRDGDATVAGDRPRLDDFRAVGA